MSTKLFLILFLGACQNFNSNTYDVQQYGSTTVTGTSNFQTAFPVIKNRCATCHQHSAWSSYTTEEKWLQTGYIVAGNKDASSLITRIINYGPSGDMPQGQGAIPATEYDALVNWVENITP